MNIMSWFLVNCNDVGIAKVYKLDGELTGVYGIAFYPGPDKNYICNRVVPDIRYPAG